jgi:hypothetical protein
MEKEKRGERTARSERGKREKGRRKGNGIERKLSELLMRC